MKDLAFVIVIVLSVLILVLLTLMQAASQSLKVALVLSIFMGIMSSFIAAMIAFTVDDNLPSDFIYKIMFICQAASGLISIMLYLQPCFEPQNWQRSWNNSLQRLVDKLAGVDSFEDEKRNQSEGSLPHGLINTNSSYDTTRNLDSNTSGTRNGGINLVDVSYSDKGG